MKKSYQFILLVLVVLTVSCGSLNEGHSKKEQMKMDAYALANVQCEYEIAKFVYDTSAMKAPLKADRVNKKNDMAVLQRKFFNRYRENEGDYEVFRKMLESAALELSTCRKLEALKEEQEAGTETENKEKKEAN